MAKRRFLTKLLFYAVCFLGCLYQVVDILELYYRYDYITEVIIDTPLEFRPPELSICFRYVDLFDRKSWAEDRNITLPSIFTRGGYKVIANLTQQFTVEDIFKYTPQTKDIFQFCYIRKDKGYAFNSSERLGCYEFFGVRKFYLQEFICYKIHVTMFEKSLYKLRNIGYSLIYQGMIYVVVLDKQQFAAIRVVKVILNKEDDFPETSSAFTQAVTIEAADYFFHVNFFRLIKKQLEAPYRTRCINYASLGVKSKSICYRTCLTNKTIEAFRKVPFSVIATEPLSYKHINIDDIENVTFADELDRIEYQCNAICVLSDCYTNNYFSMSKIEKSTDNAFGVEVMLPRQPSFSVDNNPKMHANEVIIYVLSCLGTWFGISALSALFQSKRFFKKVINKQKYKVENAKNATLFQSRGDAGLDVRKLRLDVRRHREDFITMSFNMVMLTDKVAHLSKSLNDIKEGML